MKKVYYGEAGDEDGKKEENNKFEEDYKKRKRNRKLEKDNDEDRSRKGEVSARNKDEKV